MCSEPGIINLKQKKFKQCQLSPHLKKEEQMLVGSVKKIVTMSNFSPKSMKNTGSLFYNQKKNANNLRNKTSKKSKRGKKQEDMKK